MSAFSAFPTLTAGRTVLRELVPDDAADLLVFRGDPEVQKYNSEPLREVAEATLLIDELRAAYQTGEAIHWAITLVGEPRVVGLGSLASWSAYHRRAEIGYDLRRDHWHRGVATEAVAAMVRFGFTAMDLHRIEASTIADNYGSVRLLERLGFRREGLRRACSWEEDGRFHDSAMYGLLRGEWAASQDDQPSRTD